MALEAPEDLTRQIVGHMVFVVLLGSFCAYMLYHSEREAKRLLIIKKVWSPNKPITDESAALARFRLRLIILYGGILALCLFLFQLSARMLWDRSQQEEQVVVTEEASPSGHETGAGAGATAPAKLGGNEGAARSAHSEVSPKDEAPVQPSKQPPPRSQARTGPDEAPMVLVPGGTFWMGISDDERDRAIEECTTQFKKEAASCKGLVLSAQPRHRVTLDPFSLDPYEVTNRQFEQFVQATGYETTAEKEGTASVRIAGQGWQETKGATGSNRKRDRRSLRATEPIIPSSMCHGMMPRPIAAGQASGCRRRPSLNMPLGLERRRPIGGGISRPVPVGSPTSRTKAAGTVCRSSSPDTTMDISPPRQWGRMRPIRSGCSI
ncbi:MAG: SUMF1/EgtB/PvdO family nonheme iron enzyme [Nitrospira sp.]|nr:SUMF1/EgtB/PvdO family nonheme iron enzyme [Nitrospira sp.]